MFAELGTSFIYGPTDVQRTEIGTDGKLSGFLLADVLELRASHSDAVELKIADITALAATGFG